MSLIFFLSYVYGFSSLCSHCSQVLCSSCSRLSSLISWFLHILVPWSWLPSNTLVLLILMHFVYPVRSPSELLPWTDTNTIAYQSMYMLLLRLFVSLSCRNFAYKSGFCWSLCQAHSWCFHMCWINVHMHEEAPPKFPKRVHRYQSFQRVDYGLCEGELL